MKNIYALTEPTPVDSVPSYVSINEKPDGTVWLYARTRGAKAVAEIQLTHENLLDLMTGVHEFLFKDEQP